jgi:hypothetical protein
MFGRDFMLELFVKLAAKYLNEARLEEFAQKLIAMISTWFSAAGYPQLLAFKEEFIAKLRVAAQSTENTIDDKGVDKLDFFLSALLAGFKP